jgi:hypothetical protein
LLDRQYVYFPAPWEPRDWAQASGLPLEEVWFRAKDGTRLFGWFLQAPPLAAAVLLWAHGNAGNIIHRLDPLAELHRRGLSVFIFDYRGYGRSKGTPSEEGLYLDALAAYDHLLNERKIPPARIIAYGSSLGAAVAGELARQRLVAGLILETPFPSVEAVARSAFRGLPAHLFVQARYELARRLGQVRVPVLVLHGDRDSMIPFELGRAVFDAANEPKEFVTVHGADHNDLHLVGGETYYQAILQFTRRVTTA